LPRDYRSAWTRRIVEHRLSRPRRHVWYARSVYAVILLGGGFLLYWLRGVLLPFIISAIIVYLLEPFVTRLQRWHVPRWLGVITSYLLFIASVTLFTGYLVPKLEVESSRLLEKVQVLVRETPGYIRQFEANVEDLLGRVAPEEETLPPPAPPSLKWARGPQIEPIEEVQLGMDVPHLPPVRFQADEPTAGSMLAAVQGAEGAPTAAEPAGERANLVISQIGEGVYGVKVNDNTIEVEHVGEGRYNFVARSGRLRGSTAANLREEVMASLQDSVEKLGGHIISAVVSLFQSLITGIIGGIIAVIVTFMVAAFLLIDLPRIKALLRARIPQRYQADYDDLVTRLDGGLSGVVRGQLVVCLVNGSLSFIGFLIFIPEYAIVMAVLAAVMSLIPIFGTIMGTIPAVLIGLTVSFGTALAVLAWILGVHFVEANILNPKIVGTNAHIHPAIVMFVIIAGEKTFGIAGALLAVPVAAIVQNIVQFAWSRAERVILRREPSRTH
jgi:predicted PurR-regulated permease PerM